MVGAELVLRVELALTGVRVVVEVVADKPLGLGLGAKEETKAVRVEEAPREGVQEVAGETKAGRQRGNERDDAVCDEHDEGKVCRAREVSKAHMITTHRNGSKREKMTLGLRKNWCVRSWIEVLKARRRRWR